MIKKTPVLAIDRENEYRGHRVPDQRLGNGFAQHNRLIPQITKAALSTLGIVHRVIRDSELYDSFNAFETVKIGKREKVALVVDVIAERLAAIELGRRLKQFDPLILGEESLQDENLDLANESRLVALLDMVDGTDLFERGLGNWCSAAAFFLPDEREIVGAFVGTPEGVVYYWTIDTPVPLKFDLRTKSVEPVRGPSEVRNLAESSIAFYGQKVVNFCSCASTLAHERNRQLQTKGLSVRIYDLAGIPMMMNVIDGAGHRRIDAVFEIVGQNPHDVVPGAIIAQRAGATVLDLDGNPLDLVAALLRPADPNYRLKYVLAATPELAAELLKSLRVNKETKQSLRQPPFDLGEAAA